MKPFSSKFFLITLLIGMISLFYVFEGHQYLSFAYIKENLDDFIRMAEKYPWKVILLFGGAYLFLTAMAIPGSIVLTILSGALFGTFFGTLLVTIIGTLGATISFLISRFILKDFVTRKFSRQFKTINRNLDKDGVLYLFTLRFIPVSPFVIINLVMGVTALPAWTFIWTTCLGMLPGNLIYVWAGQKISEIDSPSEIMTPSFLISLTLLGLFPLIVKKIIKTQKKKVAHV